VFIIFFWDLNSVTAVTSADVLNLCLLNEGVDFTLSSIMCVPRVQGLAATFCHSQRLAGHQVMSEKFFETLLHCGESARRTG
jgi:hypothetical protein